MKLSTKQIKFLKGLAHHLNPLVQMGKQGYSEAFVIEVKRGLKDHELIKVKLSCADRAELAEISETLPADTESHLVQVIGHTAVLYKKGEEPKIVLPKD